MLLIISDLHISDESTSKNVNPAAFELLKNEIMTVVNSNKEVKEIHIVLLGDIFDPVRTDYWLRNAIPRNERPWGGILDSDTGMNNNADLVERQFTDIFNDIFKTLASIAFTDMLNEISVISNLETKVTYVIGNHDRIFNNYPSLQKMLRNKLNKVTKDGTRDDLFEFCNVLDALEYGVRARHGYEWDENCHSWQFLTKVLKPGSKVGRFDCDVYKVMSLGEVITAELMGGIIYRISQRVSEPEFINNVKDANNVRPLSDVFLWLEWFGRDKLPDKKQIILNALRESIDGVLESEFARRWDNLVNEIWLFRGDLTDRLDQLASFIKNKSFDEIKVNLMRGLDIYEFFDNIFGNGKDEYVNGAKEEFEKGKLPINIQYILYGHTHDAKSRYFSNKVNGKTQMYINTGTYMPLIERTLNKNDFSSAHRMTMAYFFKSDEDTKDRVGNGPTVDIWNGMRMKVYA
ncbi:MAG: hypothetical protein EHM58_02085 [Ignavibacteriae bacterium]|nr:MAG: hypothetical protein EHM58_02085 [Ignavibacteriota bacterium]